MAVPTLLELAEAGAHFGHHRSLTYPKAKEFVYGIRNNVALINLEKTQEAIEEAQKMIDQYLAENKTILFVGTKRSTRDVVKEVAEKIHAGYITERWFGGTLTNFETILGNIKRMNELEKHLQTETVSKLSKKERLNLQNRLARYHRFLGGMANIKTMPDLIILASASEDKIAIQEADQLGIPVIAISDTDVNPGRISCPIPANDDAPKAVEMIMRTIVEKPSLRTKEKAKETVVGKTDQPATKETKKTAKKTVTSKKEVKKTKVPKAKAAAKK